MPDNTQRPELLVPDARVVSIDEARAEQERKQRGRSVGRDNDIMYRKDFNADMTRALTDLNGRVTNGIAEGLLAVGQKMYDQLSEESATFLEGMERDIEARVLARLANERRERSWRRRARRLLIRLGWKEQGPALVADTGASPDVDEALLREVENAALEEVQRDGE